MSECANEECNKDPFDSMNMLSVNCDGDMACDGQCKKEYEKQRDHFFDNIGNDNFYNNWLNGNN